MCTLTYILTVSSFSPSLILSNRDRDQSHGRDRRVQKPNVIDFEFCVYTLTELNINNFRSGLNENAKLCTSTYVCGKCTCVCVCIFF